MSENLIAWKELRTFEGVGYRDFIIWLAKSYPNMHHDLYGVSKKIYQTYRLYHCGDDKNKKETQHSNFVKKYITNEKK